MKTLIIMDGDTEMKRIEGTFLAVYPSSSGISITAEGDFTPVAKAFRPYLVSFFQMFMSKGG